MGRPIGTKNIMRTPEEKERIVNEYLNGRVGLRFVCASYEISYSTLREWISAYREKRIDGLKSNTGRKTGGNKGQGNKKLTGEEELKRIILRQQIEIERLKKGYYVKGAGPRKEYTSTYKENTK